MLRPTIHVLKTNYNNIKNDRLYSRTQMCTVCLLVCCIVVVGIIIIDLIVITQVDLVRPATSTVLPVSCSQALGLIKVNKRQKNQTLKKSNFLLLFYYCAYV